MGIPSFYRRLSLAHKGLIGKDRGAKVAALYFDFNCLIYSVVRSPSMPVYSASQHTEWESALLNQINTYVANVWKEAGSPPEVFLSVDGVVPVAKIKQQRLRRFKSSWMVQEEIARGIRPAGESWDTNAITPGTLFMEKLGKSLQDFCQRHGKGWSVSGADEPGEGEQKIMKVLRNRDPSSYEGSVIVYGLDADLILLTLLNGVGRGYPACYLMRENKEFGHKDLGNEFSYLAMNKLPELLWKDFLSLTPEQKRMRIANYVCGMSLLGNDFLPHSLSVHVRDDGHEWLSRDLLALEKEGQQLLVSDPTGIQTLNIECCKALLSKWATRENDAILQCIRKKRAMRNSVVQVDAEQVLQALPLEWDVEQEVVTYKKQEDGKFRIEFLPIWKRVYYEKWLKNHNMDDLVKQYIYGVQWIYDYYTGQRAIPLTWMFPSSLPPLWSDLVAKMPEKVPTIEPLDVKPLLPQQQLTMVLPLSSWYLIRQPKFRKLPSEYPQYFPKAFGFFSVGRRHLWECEPNICHLPISLVQ